MEIPRGKLKCFGGRISLAYLTNAKEVCEWSKVSVEQSGRK